MKINDKQLTMLRKLGDRLQTSRQQAAKDEENLQVFFEMLDSIYDTNLATNEDTINIDGVITKQK